MIVTLREEIQQNNIAAGRLSVMAQNSRGSSIFWKLAYAAGSTLLGTMLFASSVQAAVGRTAGSFSVSPSASAAYTIPIFTPPGPRGMQPSIALVYNSNGGVGYIGRGWSLAGFSAISVCTFTFAQDGFAAHEAPYAYSTPGGYEKAYCLDGNRLRRQSSYGFTTDWATEIADFSRVRSYSALNSWGNADMYWKVERKDGTTYTYGTSADSVVGPNFDTTRQWLLREISDRYGNTVRFTYKSPDASTSGTTHPTKIEWTATYHGSTSFLYSMEFGYDGNSNAASSSYLGAAGGNSVLDKDLLRSISVKNDSTTVRKYVLGYSTAPTTGGKRLTTVTECSDAAGADCLSPTTIGYQDGQAGFATSPSFTGSSASSPPYAQFDFNGDGLADLAYRSSSDWVVRFATGGGDYGPEKSTGVDDLMLMAGDPLGSGRDVIMGLKDTSTWYAFTWDGNSFVSVSTGIDFTGTTIVSLADVNGDGRDDLVYTPYGTGPSSVYASYSTSTGTSVSFSTSIVPYGASTNAQSYLVDWWDTGYGSIPMYGYILGGVDWVHVAGADTSMKRGYDVNADGRQDLILDSLVDWIIPPDIWNDCESWIYGCYPGSYGTMPYNFVATSVFGNGYVEYTGSSTDSYTPASLNSDSCADTMTGSDVNFSTCTTVGTSSAAAGPIVGTVDWNSDGRQDLVVYVTGSTYSIQLSTGEGLGAVQSTSIPTSCNSFFVVDADGDGQDDLGCDTYTLVCYPNPNCSPHTFSIYLHNGAMVTPDLATSFADGFGVTHTVTYRNSTQGPSEGYTLASTPSTYPNRDIKSAQVIVRNVNSTDGAGGTYDTTYSYFGSTANVQGRGWQGFEKIESADSRTVSGVSIKHVQRFDHDPAHAFPLTGTMVEDSSYQSTGAPISIGTTTWSSTTLDSTANNQRYFVFPASSVEDVYEVGGTKNGDWITRAATSNTFSSWGNLEASTRTVTDEDASSPLYNYAWVTSSSTIFSPNTASWCLGLPISTSVTQSTTTGEATVTRGKGFTPDYYYCRMDAESVEPSSSTLRVDTSYGYDSFGNVNSVSVTGRNPDTSSMTARTSTTSWGTTGQFPVSATDPLSQTTTRTFHSTFGSLLTETDPNGIYVANNYYDSFGRINYVYRPDGTYTAYSYNNCATYSACLNGDPGSGATGIDKMFTVVVNRDASGSNINVSEIHSDSFDRPIVEISQAMAGQLPRSGRQYDALGRVYREIAPCSHGSCSVYWTTNTYDVLGRLSTQSRPTSDSNPTPVTTTFAYAGRTQTVTDPPTDTGSGLTSKVTTKVMDVNGWMRRSRDHDSYGQNFTYDAAGSLTGVTDTASNPLFTASYSYGAKPFQTVTTDMDLGRWAYKYDSLGELVEWQDANTYASNPSLFPFSQTYDALSRVTSRTEPDGSTGWGWGNSSSAKNIGQLATVTQYDNTPTTVYAESYYYDSAGRLEQRNISSDSLYYYHYTYNNQGLLDTLTYPTSTSSTRVKVKYGYAYGMLQTVTDWTSGSAGTVYWTATTQNPRGQTTQETLGNGVVTNRGFDAVTGRLNSIQSGVSGGTGLQNLSYFYDAVGNVAQRQDYIGSLPLTESFFYDNLYRLDYSTLNQGSGAATNLDLSYDAMGNIQSKTEEGVTKSYTYGHSTKKHAVTGYGSDSYTYDANGNMTSRAGQTINWSSFNYPTYLATATENTTFYYGPDRQYYRQDYNGPSTSETTYYVGGVLEKVCPSASCASGTIDWRHYIVAQGQTVAIVSRKSSGSTPNTVSYPLEDNQGSISTISDGSGNPLARESFKAFGEQRDGDDWAGPEASGDLTTIEGYTRRGYTGHSMLGRMGLIHMNGRVYDSTIGRFLSADPYVAEPNFTQGYNRYAYVTNNPLTYTDPSGFRKWERCVWVHPQQLVERIGFVRTYPEEGKRNLGSWGPLVGYFEWFTPPYQECITLDLPDLVLSGNERSGRQGSNQPIHKDLVGKAANSPQEQKFKKYACSRPSRGAVSGAFAGAAYTLVMQRGKPNRYTAGAALIGGTIGAFEGLDTGTQIQVAIGLSTLGAGGALVGELLLGRVRPSRVAVAGGAVTESALSAGPVPPLTRTFVGGVIGASVESYLSGQGVRGFGAGAAAQAAAMFGEELMDFGCEN